MNDGWATASGASVGLSQSTLDSLNASIEAGDFGDVTSVLVARGGTLVHEAYYGGNEATLRNTRSVTKTLVGMLIGVAIEHGDIPGVDAPVIPFLRQRPAQNLDPRKAEITIQDLLTMSSILECDDWNQFSAGNEERMYVREDWTQFALDLPIKGAAPWESPASERPYGRAFNYCTAGVHMLGRAVEGAMGESVGDLAETHVFAPLGIESQEWQYTGLREHNVAGGLGLRSRDLLKLGQVYASGGMWNGERILPEAWANASMEPHVAFQSPMGDDYEYGYLLWRHTYEAAGESIPTVYMTGTGGNRVLIAPSLDLVVVVTSENFGRRDAHGLTDRVLTEYVFASAE